MIVVSMLAMVLCAILSAVGFYSWGVPGFLLGPVCVLAIFLLGFVGIIGIFMAPNIAERYLERRGIQVPERLHFPGFFMPLGALRMVSRPAEYLAMVAACDGSYHLIIRLLFATAFKPVTARGLADADFLNAAARSNGPRAVIREAVTLSTEYGGDRVVQYARHPSGARRGFEMLRQGVPYEYAEMLP